jgi:hypothetical protein
MSPHPDDNTAMRHGAAIITARNLGLPLTGTCPECGRVFDLLDEDDAAELAYGHDCEPECAQCNGAGYIPAIGPDQPASGYVECDQCHATGESRQ